SSVARGSAPSAPSSIVAMRTAPNCHSCGGPFPSTVVTVTSPRPGVPHRRSQLPRLAEGGEMYIPPTGHEIEFLHELTISYPIENPSSLISAPRRLECGYVVARSRLTSQWRRAAETPPTRLGATGGRAQRPALEHVPLEDVPPHTLLWQLCRPGCASSYRRTL